ncbi:MAG: hypothetical protein JKY46_02425 [Robiginitomaculum sp.]|nr:hypothetical protein [Robiginitomaculum sp.]
MVDPNLLWLSKELALATLPVILVTILVSALAAKLLSMYSLLAVPNSRSAHQQPIATAGGFSLVLGIGAGSIWLAFSSDLLESKYPVLFGLSSLAMLLGFIDDAYEVSAKLKFSLIGILSLAMAFLLGPVTVIPFDTVQLQLPWVIAIAGTGLFVFTLINSVNFIDGSDGAIPLSACAAAVIMVILAGRFEVWEAFWSSLLLATALGGFLPFNMPKAKVFLGDTGSLFIGSWFAGTALMLVVSGPPAVLWLMPLLFMPWLSDVLLTMAWRLLKKQNLMLAHNDHLYQCMIKSGKSHRQVAIWLMVQIIAAGSMAMLFSISATSAFLGFSAAASLALLVHLQVRKTVTGI